MADMMTEAEALKALKQHGSLYAPEDGYHFKGISGSHLNGYCNIDPVLPFPKLLSRMTEAIVTPFRDEGIETVFVPATGAIPLAEWGPYHLERITGSEVCGIWGDKVKPRGFTIERDGFLDAIKGKKVLILEDMINKMFSVRELVRLVKENNGRVVGVGSIISNNRNGVSAEAIGVPQFTSLAWFGYDVWDEDSCELCAQRVPMVTDIGHGGEFADEHPDYPTAQVLKANDKH